VDKKARVFYLRHMVNSVTPQQAQELITNGNFDIVDVREPVEWSSGHLPGSRLVPLQSLRSNPKGALPRDGIIFVCAAGVRSQTAAKVAEANGRTNLYNLAGGTKSWANAGLPLVHD
jgi:rhodanese-related sulfurtransferase